MNDFIIIVLSYCGVFLLSLVVMNFLMVNFFTTYMRVKGSRGKLVLVNVYTVARNYFRTGKIEDGFLVYKDGNKHEKRLALPKNTSVFYRSLNVTLVNVDEERNVFILPSSHEISGFDAEKYNNLYLRTLYRPSINDNVTNIMLVLSILGFLLLLAITYSVMFKMPPQLSEIQSSVEAMKVFMIGLNSTGVPI